MGLIFFILNVICDNSQYSLSSHLQEDLDGFASKYPDRFKVYYVVSEVLLFLSHQVIILQIAHKSNLYNLSVTYLIRQPPPDWDAGIGHISKETIQEHCPRPAADVLVNLFRSSSKRRVLYNVPYVTRNFLLHA